MEHVSVGTTGWVGLHPKEYARQFDTVEFNWTFHEREESAEQFGKVAQDCKQLRLQAVLKVSGLATHENRLRNSGSWWPGLWAKYSQLQKAGVLGGLLWQLPPSFRFSFDTLRDLESLAAQLPRDVLNIFEFRHSSWYNQSKVTDTLRRHKLCMAWIHIVNEDGWCGDLSSGWPGMTQTCPSIYFRLFGTKRKAVGRYSDDFLRGEILPRLQASSGCQSGNIFVVFAQADVPDHAKADASALMDLLGRTTPNPSRSTRWERDVLSASLGLAAGTVVDGVVQRISHRTILIDIGRSCRATLCAHHARRVGLLESLHVGTDVQGLVVENVDAQNEWIIIGLTCHNAVIGALGGDLSVADPNAASSTEVVIQEAAAHSAKKSRWNKANPADDVGDAANGEPMQPQVTPSAASTSDSQAPRTKRWGRQEFPPAAKKRELEALERAEARKGQTHIYIRIPNRAPKKARLTQEGTPYQKAPKKVVNPFRRPPPYPPPSSHRPESQQPYLILDSDDLILDTSDVNNGEIDQSSATVSDLHPDLSLFASPLFSPDPASRRPESQPCSSSRASGSWAPTVRPAQEPATGKNAQKSFPQLARLRAASAQQGQVRSAASVINNAREVDGCVDDAHGQERSAKPVIDNTRQIARRVDDLMGEILFLRKLESNAGKAMKTPEVQEVVDNVGQDEAPPELDAAHANYVAERRTQSQPPLRKSPQGHNKMSLQAHVLNFPAPAHPGPPGTLLSEQDEQERQRELQEMHPFLPIQTEADATCRETASHAEKEQQGALKEDSHPESQRFQHEYMLIQAVRWQAQAASKLQEAEMRGADLAELQDLQAALDEIVAATRSAPKEHGTGSEPDTEMRAAGARERQEVEAALDESIAATLSSPGAQGSASEWHATEISVVGAGEGQEAEATSDEACAATQSSPNAHGTTSELPDAEMSDAGVGERPEMEQVSVPDRGDVHRDGRRGAKQKEACATAQSFADQDVEMSGLDAGEKQETEAMLDESATAAEPFEEQDVDMDVVQSRDEQEIKVIPDEPQAAAKPLAEQDAEVSIVGSEEEQKTSGAVDEGCVAAQPLLGTETHLEDSWPELSRSKEVNSSASRGKRWAKNGRGAEPETTESRQAQHIGAEPETTGFEANAESQQIGIAEVAPHEELCVGPGEHRVECQECGSEYFLDVELSDFACSRLGLSCGDAQADEEAASDDYSGEEEDEEEVNSDDDVNEDDGVEEDDGDIYIAVCDSCGASHLMDVDVMSLGIDFTCSHVGFQCEGAAASSALQPDDKPGSATPVLPARAAKLEALSSDEKRDLFRRHAQQLQAARLSSGKQKKDIHKGVQQLFAAGMPKERYRDSEVVTRKGERFIKINVSLDPGPGCQIGGILGWRSKLGRRGLGIQKMTKEERERVCISNKNRAHDKKATGPGGSKPAYTFENKITLGDGFEKKNTFENKSTKT